MQGLLQFWAENDAIGRTVVVLLLAMSVSAWVLIFWKGWVLTRARRDIDRAIGAFWGADSLDAGRTRLAALDREQVLLPLLEAGILTEPAGTLATRAALGSQLTRRLREALQRSDVDPRRLHIELTETAVMINPDRSVAVMESLRDIG